MQDKASTLLTPNEDTRLTDTIDVADIVVDVVAPYLQPVYTYGIPPDMSADLRAGACVHVNFHGRERLGYVMELRKLSASDDLVPKLHPILAILADDAAINREQLEIVRWMSERYVCDLMTAVRCVAPAVLGSMVVSRVKLNPVITAADHITRSVSQSHIVTVLQTFGGEADLDELRDTCALPSFSSAIAALISKDVIRVTKGIAAPRVVAKIEHVYTLSQYADRLLTETKIGPQQRRIVNFLAECARSAEPSQTFKQISEGTQCGRASLKGLVDKGIISLANRTQRRSSYAGIPTGTQAPVLTPGQRTAAERIRECIALQTEQSVLLFGVTASGKTEVYLDAISHALALGRSAIVLVPEIALTAQVVEVFVGRFGEQVAVLHSRLSEGERHDEWRRLQLGHARIVVGARSAIFAPVSNVGLIVVDEEHEASYKQENSPRYNARDLAAERARISGATLLLGSATPSVETYWASSKDAKTTLSETGPRKPILRITMNSRIDSRPMPHVEVVDLREEFKVRRALFSERLATAIGERLLLRQQSILFLNRRGYSQFVLCRDCGWTAKCRNCAVALTFHSFDNTLKCHHCGYSGRTPVSCPECRGLKVKAFGVGTEKVEEEVLRLYPSARVARMDRDTTSTKGSHGRIIRAFRENEADVLIGTQMVAKGLDFPNVTLVGVITADTAINMPDFRAAERTFQLLTQVAGRSGRGSTPGEVIIQTFSPDHFAVRAATQHDYVEFYEQEIRYRKELNYPPFSHMANIICSHEKESAARAHSSAIAAALLAVKTADIEIIGPSPAPIARIKNQFRYHVALRAPVSTSLSHVVKLALSRLKREDRKGLAIDIDPLSMA